MLSAGLQQTWKTGCHDSRAGAALSALRSRAAFLPFTGSGPGFQLRSFRGTAACFPGHPARPGCGAGMQRPLPGSAQRCPRPSHPGPTHAPRHAAWPAPPPACPSGSQPHFSAMPRSRSRAAPRLPSLRRKQGKRRDEIGREEEFACLALRDAAEAPAASATAPEPARAPSPSPC